MPQVQPEVEAFARIRVVGAGGSGGNAINHMIESKVRGVDFIAVNTDAQDLHNSTAKKKIHIGKNITRGLGAGMNPEVGKRAAEETQEEISQALRGSDMVFVACGMGGGTGTGAAPVVARTAKQLGALTVGVVTKPFSFEGQQRMRLADAGLEELRKEVDAIIIVPNDRLLATVEKQTTLKQAFAMCDDVLKQAVEGISELITQPGIINVDFADIRAVMENAGSALMGVGIASGENRAQEAAKAAISSPLLEISVNGAKGVLFSIAGSEDLGMLEVNEAARIITENVDPNAKIIFGAVKDDKLKKNELRVTVIATGFPNASIPGAGTQQRAPMFGSTMNAATTPASRVDRAERLADKEKEEPLGFGRIFNSPIAPATTKTESTASEKAESASPAASSTEEPEKEPAKKAAKDDDDEWGAVPSFLRRPKIR